MNIPPVVPHKRMYPYPVITQKVVITKEKKPYISKPKKKKKKLYRRDLYPRSPKFYTERFHEFPAFTPVKYPKPFSGPDPTKFKPATFKSPQTQSWIRGEEQKANYKPKYQF